MQIIARTENSVEIEIPGSVIWTDGKTFSVARNGGRYENKRWEELTLEEQAAIEKVDFVFPG